MIKLNIENREGENIDRLKTMKRTNELTSNDSNSLWYSLAFLIRVSLRLSRVAAVSIFELFEGPGIKVLFPLAINYYQQIGVVLR